MTTTGTRCLGALLGSLSLLTVATFLSRAERAEPPLPKRSSRAATGDGSPAAPEAPPEVPAAERVPLEAPEPGPRASVPAGHRQARDEGYREAREATWEGTLSGQVLSPEGPLANLTVRVEWVLALQPDREEIVRLKRAGARRDKDGAWWAKALAMTDESGFFQIEGLPAVPLRVHAGSTTQQAQVGGTALIRTERP